ncbi:MAG: M20/M25/M40 family metallo-hydrolase [Planctomycetes bacterium]|nr:M20/M25/M40 family metallo-hydrolase [Planctomycetota bacterium]
MADLPFDREAAVTRLLRFLAVGGITGQEEAIGTEVVSALVESGVPSQSIRFDQANKRIPLPTQTGNLIVTLPGTVSGPRRLFMTHLDTVPLCAGAVPVRKGDRIVPQGKTALGGDNRTGVACLVTMLATLLARKLPHGPLSVLFTVREESGLWGARYVDSADLGKPEMGFNIDGRSPREITIGATGAERWQVEIFGRASHAGAYPEQGISASMVGSLALAEVQKGGWFGKIKKGTRQGTSNVGSIGGPNGTSAGQATNVVTDYTLITGECRSHDSKFNRAITAAYRDAFQNAARKIKNASGKHAKIRFATRRDYYPFKLKESSLVVRIAADAAKRAGWDADLRITNGGLDANWLTRHGIPTITFGAGQNNIHTVEEYVHVPDFLEGCRYALSLTQQ